MDIKNIIIQAGGRGLRLETLTLNKPKCIVPINNLPLIFYLFKKFPDAKFSIISDYKKDVLQKYLDCFCDVDFKIIEPNKKGTCSGIKDSVSSFSDKEAFMLIWCDLILSENFSIPDVSNNYVGISKDFECRWSYKDGEFDKIPSKENGVAGLFIFKNKLLLSEVPDEGEFVAWLKTTPIKFERLDLNGTQEIGTMLSYNETEIDRPRCRPFNELVFSKDRVIKKGIDAQGLKIAEHEVNWYKKIASHNYKNIPQIFSYHPIEMAKINGKNVFEYHNLNLEQKQNILHRIIRVLKSLHSLESPIKANVEDCQLAYIDKTFERLEKVKCLVPFADKPIIKINGEYKKNIFFYKDDTIKKIKEFFPDEFSIIHGDPTFSNIMLENKDIIPILIDPRGYFGNTQIFGDVDYDWAKLYYSAIGNYDQFNRKQFFLEIKENEVFLKINSSNWEDTEDFFFKNLPDINPDKIKLLHAIIWLSLTTYAWEDYDSICGAFYNGLIHLSKVI